jgi:hypothetical protein
MANVPAITANKILCIDYLPLRWSIFIELIAHSVAGVDAIAYWNVDAGGIGTRIAP